MLKVALIIGLLAAVAWYLINQVARAANVPAVGQLAPQFTLTDQEGKPRTLTEFSGSWLVLYFYPKDDTPGCTEEACTFRDDLHQLNAMGAKVVGVSVDSADSHAAFAQKYHLPFPLLADKEGEVADKYGALLKIGPLKIARRYTFLIGPDGKVRKVYLKVATSRHSKEIIDDLKGFATP